MEKHYPKNIELRKKSRRLIVTFDTEETFDFSAEFLRVYSPSADVKGHSPGQAVLQVGKEDATIEDVEPIGNYAVRLVFGDGHDTGLYTWDYLYEMGVQKKEYWGNYREALQLAGHVRVSKNEDS
ncbi:MAG: DUF971 domain-containing protein [Proteobacteria bacterium]|jgi:DUF971 family protein|nr:DUF971 domain-containing protein [Pseudomonadota bacterium]MBT5065828.1 DUF971 domain-containing protein [Pseudomonadota bacterium]MBT6192308.1 DUF971 domain-containing protein [Pseudomonadota bacterium]MBT6465473.1 DUF971 domain-containing protein [Pseudomonadota bacterium]MBT6674896.1 DUF971 domain-containing protein [Pseudomonadota bacterium]